MSALKPNHLGLLRAAPFLCVLALTAGCRYRHYVVPDTRLGAADVIIVPGVALTAEGQPRALLYNRVAMAWRLLDQGFASRMLVTGGKPRAGITEAARMVQIARSFGIPAQRILIAAGCAPACWSATGFTSAGQSPYSKRPLLPTTSNFTGSPSAIAS